MNLALLLDRAARVFPERTALALGAEDRADFRSLAARCAALAGSLRTRLGLDPGDRVAVFMKNTPEYLEIMLASWWAGLAVVPVNARLHPAELGYILADSGARVLFVHPGEAPALPAGAHPGLTVLPAGGADWARLLAGPALALQPALPEALAWLFYTSGTTGRPKGVMLSHRNLLAMTLAYFCDVDSIGLGQSIIHAAPISHGSGLYALPHLAAAAAQVIPESGGFDPAEILSLTARRPGASLFAAPTMLKRMVQTVAASGAPVDGIRTIVYGGGPMYLADIREALAVIGQRLVQIYGQGESPMTITVLGRTHLADTAHARYNERIASVGVPHTGVEVQVADPEGRSLAPGETGEVRVRGDVVMQGYWNNPQASSQTLAGGWLHTGDLGRFDADGFLTLVDRSKDLIISGGSNIYPREVEEVLLLHPAVSEAAVIGARDPLWGETVVAFIVPQEGAAADAALLDAHCLNHLARFKRPRSYRIVAALPKNNYGKVLKTALREALGAPGP
jgi:long-chain acyl-CoA synthetase